MAKALGPRGKIYSALIFLWFVFIPEFVQIFNLITNSRIHEILIPIESGRISGQDKERNSNSIGTVRNNG